MLIIGILAAVALPQYTKAVERSRTAEAIQRLGDMATAQQIIYMQYGTFANSTANLKNLGDITFSTFDTNSYTVGVSGGGTGSNSATMTAERKNGQYSGATLQLAVIGDGGIQKKCTATGDKAEFCNLVASAGYGNNTWK